MDSANTPTAEQPAAKPAWQSRTLWFNALCLAAAAAEQNVPLLQGVLPGNVYAWLAFIVPLGNAALRMLTTTGVSVRPGPPA